MKRVSVTDELQQAYTYTLTEPSGKNFAQEFKPELTPQQMLEVGIFGGSYFESVPKEFPKAWFAHARISHDGKPDKTLNYFGERASQSRAVWQEKGWIHRDDPRGWFQWYCRYYLGRRHPDDARQIRRWYMMRRHVSQIVQRCRAHDLTCRRRQRQAVLQWAYDSRKF